MEPQGVLCDENLQNNSQIVIVTPSGDQYTITPVISVIDPSVEILQAQTDSYVREEIPTNPQPEPITHPPEVEFDSAKLDTQQPDLGATGIPCRACNRSFDHQESLTRHIRAVHAEIKPTICPICCKDFKRLDVLAHHSVICESTDNKYHCRECGHVVTTLLQLEDHETAHAAERHVCRDCGAIFKRRDHLTRHYKSRHVVESIECLVCKRIFRRKDHMLRHVREKHRLIISYSFKRLDVLAHHSVICESTDNKYHCRECGHVVTTLLQLEDHETAHAAERHVCRDCGAIFKRRDHLTRHYKSRHVVESIECLVCKRIFRRKDHMLRHVREKHRLMYVNGKLIRLRTYCVNIP